MAGLDVLQEAPKAPVTGEKFVVTDAAARAIEKYLVENGATPTTGLRIGVRGGGCSGLSYFLDPDAAGSKPGDLVIEKLGVKVFIDPKSLLFLQGTTLDYVTGLMESGFKFNNPKSAKACGCGESFTPV